MTPWYYPAIGKKGFSHHHNFDPSQRNEDTALGVGVVMAKLVVLEMKLETDKQLPAKPQNWN